MIETLLGGLLGGAFRLAPEFLKHLDRRDERAHELAMQDKALEFERLRGAQRMAEIGAASDFTWHSGSLDALREMVNGRTLRAGWANILSASVRPIVTYGFMGLYCGVKFAAWRVVIGDGADTLTALQATWTEADQALWAGVLNFWFVGRVFDRIRP